MSILPEIHRVDDCPLHYQNTGLTINVRRRNLHPIHPSRLRRGLSSVLHAQSLRFPVVRLWLEREKKERGVCGRTVEEQRIIRPRVTHEPMHGVENVFPRR